MRVKIRRRVPSPIWWSGVGGKETGDKSESRTRPGELPPRSQENVLKKKERWRRKTESDPSGIEQYGQENPLD